MRIRLGQAPDPPRRVHKVHRPLQPSRARLVLLVASGGWTGARGFMIKYEGFVHPVVLRRAEPQAGRALGA